MTELAVTEHLFRFRQADALLGGFWDDERVPPALAESMAEYWKFHATADLDAYVECALEAKEAGLPVVIGLEVDYYEGRMDEVAGLLAGYPFDVLLGLGALGGRRGASTTSTTRCRWPSGRPARSTPAGRPTPRRMEELAASRRLRRAGPPRPDQGGGLRARRAGRVVGPHRRGGGGVGHGGRGVARPAGASRWASSTRPWACSSASSPAACRSPRRRTPTGSSTWPTGPTTCAPCWARRVPASCRATGARACLRRCR